MEQYAILQWAMIVFLSCRSGRRRTEGMFCWLCWFYSLSKDWNVCFLGVGCGCPCRLGLLLVSRWVAFALGLLNKVGILGVFSKKWRKKEKLPETSKIGSQSMLCEVESPKGPPLPQKRNQAFQSMVNCCVLGQNHIKSWVTLPLWCIHYRTPWEQRAHPC